MKKHLFISFFLLSVLVCQSQILPVYSGWTVWSGGISNISIQTRSGSNLWLEITSSHCTHGTHQYFNTTPSTTYTIDFDLDLGTTGQVNLLIWDVTPGGTLYNLRVISYTASANGISETFLAGDTRSLIQFRQDNCSGTYSFYLDKINIWAAPTTNVIAAAPLDDGYRFGFNGKEKTDEVYGDGNFYDYGFRVYDPRIGKFLSVDPITSQYPELTPYQFASNTPIMAIDLDGKEALVTIVTTNDDGTTSILVMTDQAIENNAGASFRNRLVIDGVDYGTTYGNMGLEVLDNKMFNVRMIDGGYLAYDTPDGTVTTVQGSRTMLGSDGTLVTQLNDFAVRMETNEPIGKLNFSIPFDGSTKDGVTSGPVNLNVPANADPGSGNLSVNLTDFTQPNTSTISVSGGATTTSTPLVGAADGSAVNTSMPVGAGTNINITTPTDGTGSDDYILNGSLNYTITPK